MFWGPKDLLRRCLGVQTTTHKVFGRLGHWFSWQNDRHGIKRIPFSPLPMSPLQKNSLANERHPSKIFRFTLPETNSKAPENRPGPKRKRVFQPSIFRCEMLVSGMVTWKYEDYWDVLLVLRINGLVHRSPLYKYIGWIHPVNRWNQPTY